MAAPGALAVPSPIVPGVLAVPAPDVRIRVDSKASTFSAAHRARGRGKSRTLTGAEPAPQEANNYFEDGECTECDRKECDRKERAESGVSGVSGSTASSQSRARSSPLVARLRRLLLPVALIFLFHGFIASLILIQYPLWMEFNGDAAWASVAFIVGVSVFYGPTLMGYWWAGLGSPGLLTDGQPMPLRAHKNFRYPRPVLRYDHYCRWLDNCIGLRNHRSFLVMVLGFVLSALLSSCLDVALLVMAGMKRVAWGYELGIVVLHLVCSLIFAQKVNVILQIHLGLVSRNELGKEWIRDDFYVVDHEVKGVTVPVSELDDDDQEYYTDEGLQYYDPSRNSWDKGLWTNWRTFLFKWRCGSDGDF